MKKQMKNHKIITIALFAAFIGILSGCAERNPYVEPTRSITPIPTVTCTATPTPIPPTPTPDTSQIGAGIKINEYMSSNELVLYDGYGDAPDWIELKNYGEEAVSLAGYGLTDNFKKAFKWTFPDITLEPGACLLICLSGKEEPYDPQGLLHASFKYSDEDDGLMLSNNYGNVLDKVETFPPYDTLSIGRSVETPDKFLFFAKPTPGRENSSTGFETVEEYSNGGAVTVYISEVCAISSDRAENTPDEDWIELCNRTDTDINLEGYTLSDDRSNLAFFTFPAVTLKAGGYLTVNASEIQSASGKLDTGFKISSDGDTIYLSDNEGFVIDIFETGIQRAGVTSGQTFTENGLVREFYPVSTKSKANSAGCPAYARPVIIEQTETTLNAASHTVTLSTAQEGGSLYYTLDGSEPDASCTLYEGPFTVSSSCVVKAVCVAEGLINSDVATRTFICDDLIHTLPVLCISADPDDLYSEARGIFATGPNASSEYPYDGANYWQDWERACTFELYDESGELAVEFDAGIRVHGQFSRFRESKSFSINLKEAYGSGSVYYPFFGDSGVKSFESLVVRSGGQDQSLTCVVDAFVQRAVEDQMDIDTQDETPVALYINGVYNGLYWIREKLNEAYYETHAGIEEDNLDAIQGNTIVETGDYERQRALRRYIQTHDCSTDEALEYISSQIDLEEWMNYWVTITFFGNTDTGNIRKYSAKDGSVKWRWVVYDQDWALFSYYTRLDLLKTILNPEGHGSENMFYTDLTYNLLVVNKTSQAMFIERYAELMNTVFAPARLEALYSEMLDQVRGEIVYHCAVKEELSYEVWEKNTTYTLEHFKMRWSCVKQFLQRNFNLSDERMAELFPNDLSK